MPRCNYILAGVRWEMFFFNFSWAKLWLAGVWRLKRGASRDAVKAQGLKAHFWTPAVTATGHH